MARLPYVDPQAASPGVREALDALPPLNIFRMLAQADSAFVPYLGFAGVLLTQLELDPKLRELVILLVAARTGAEYEWVQHVGISKTLGIHDEQISAVGRGDLQAACLDPDAQAILCFAAEVLELPRVGDATFAAVSDRFPPRQIVELLLVIGNYHMLARLMTTLDIDINRAVGSTVIDEARRRLRD
ncbi:MAG TPA: carboxymuconolactone decarboxylase family protein [Solirubrobacteraceae bacterium]|jgi:alkylhydroperoxidase family enzyme